LNELKNAQTKVATFETSKDAQEYAKLKNEKEKEKS
jgi:hypothetical protein